MFQSICLLTSNLMQHDVLLRGGLAAGPLHHSRDFLYGSALNRAYLLESEKAHDPIAMLSQEVLEDAKKYGPQHMSFLVEQNGRWFIHFLLQYAVYRPKPIYQGMLILDRPGARIINFICQRLNQDSGSVRAKAEWIRAYWNETVAVHGVFGAIEEGVQERSDLGGPTIAMRRILCRRSQALRHHLLKTVCGNSPWRRYAAITAGSLWRPRRAPRGGFLVRLAAARA